MNIEERINDYLKKAAGEDGTDIGYILNACRQLYAATGNEIYKNFILRYMERKTPEDWCGNDPAESMIKKINTGKTLFFAYDMTGGEKYIKIIEQLKKETCLTLTSGKQMYEVLPFCMEYETRYNGKAGYKEIVQQFCAGETCEDAVWYAMALLDVLEQMSMEIFEHYKSLQEIFKKTIRRILTDQDAAMRNACIGYAILKACSMGILNPEKYSETGQKLIDGAIDEPLNQTDDVSVGIMMMAYAQSVSYRNYN